MSSAMSAQKFGGKTENMKRQNGPVRAAYDAFLLHELQIVFGCTADFNTSKETYPWPLIVLCHCSLTSFAEAP